jgi:hypothetical protein
MAVISMLGTAKNNEENWGIQLSEADERLFAGPRGTISFVQDFFFHQLVVLVVAKSIYCCCSPWYALCCAQAGNCMCIRRQSAAVCASAAKLQYSSGEMVELFVNVSFKFA